MKNINKLLLRQLKKSSLDLNKVPENIEEWKKFIKSVNNFYLQCEEEKYLLERSMEISSREMQERIEKNKDLGLQLAQASKLASLGTLASGVAHELNNPLQIAGGLAEMMQQDPNNADLVSRSALKIMGLVERMGNITKHLLKLSRQDQEDDRSAISISNPIFETFDLMEKQFEYDNIYIKINMPQEPIEVFANSNRLCGIFQNLLTNSRDAFFTNPNSERKSLINVDVVKNESENKVEIYFKDNAGGMPPEVLNQIFDPFFTTKEVNSGTGLGLPLSRQIIEEFGGTMNVSVVDSSTIFKVCLPLHDGNDNKQVSSISTSKFDRGDWAKTPTKRYKVLIIDDEWEICELLRLGLEDKMEVRVTSQPEEALKIIDSEEFDLVITDMRMPVVSGDKIAKKVKSKYPGTKLVVISGHIGKATPESLAGCEPFLFIEKPVKSIKELSRQLQEYMLAS